ncbi:MAG: hypothetical protein OEW06_01640 [Gemmatimonadota bacterium]|nr:hypothetical protein [Gemmatimonadota bacterium]MDH4349766.1 hypothetical protein [Gemmatimonadota bacterium]
MDPQPPRRRTEPLLDELGTAIVAGKDAASFLWQVPDDASTRQRLGDLLVQIRDGSAGQGRTEMPKLCEELIVALRAQPTPQQVDLLQDGFDRLYKLWAAAKSGLL